MEKITLEKIAQDIGVSKVAVFKALNNQKGVSDELRSKIKTRAMLLGYDKRTSPSDVKNLKFVFFIKKEFFLTPSEQFYSTIFYYLNNVCAASNCVLQIAFLEEVDTLQNIIDTSNAFSADGIFIAGEINDEILRYFETSDTPTVFIDYFSADYKNNYVYVDNYNLAYSMTKFLIANGHNNIGFVGQIDSTSAIADRFFGFVKALSLSQIQFNPNWLINNNLENTCNFENILPKELPTAFICHCDAAAQKLYTLLYLKGVKVPSEVSIVSFDNTPLCDNMLPNLTSAGPKKDAYARRAFASMVDCILNRTKQSFSPIKTYLVERNSVAKLNNKD